jgi:hypothetical protein
MSDHGFTVESLGHRIDITVTGDGAADLTARAEDAWERCLATDELAPRVAHRLRVVVRAGTMASRSVSAVSAPSHEAAMEMLSQAVTLVGVTASAGQLLMLHAAGLADPATGRTAVLVGPSGMGKSTATRALCRDWGYVSDETVALTGAGAIVAYPKPLSLIQQGHWKRQASPSSLGLAMAPQHLEPAGLVLLDRRPDGRGSMRTVGLTEAVARLAEQTSFLSHLERPLQRIAALVREAGCVEVSYAETDQLGRALAAVMDEQS